MSYVVQEEGQPWSDAKSDLVGFDPMLFSRHITPLKLKLIREPTGHLDPLRYPRIKFRETTLPPLSQPGESSSLNLTTSLILTGPSQQELIGS